MVFEVPTRFRLVSLAELLGGKLVALLDRTAARDLYDAATLADVIDPEDLFLRRVFVAMAGTLPRALRKYSVTRIQRIEERDIEAHLYPVLAFERIFHSILSCSRASAASTPPSRMS